MNPEKKQLLRNLLILILAAVLVFAGYKFYQKKKVAPPETKTVSKKLEVPEVSTELKILKVLEIKSKELLLTQNIRSGEKVEVFIPADVKPNFIGVKDIQKNYVLELFKYRPAANNLVALSLDVVKDFPTKNLLPTENGLTGGTVFAVEKGVITIVQQGPGQEKPEYKKVAVNGHTTYTRLIYVGKVSVEKPASLTNIKKGSNINVLYSKKDSTPEKLKASRIEVLELQPPTS